MIIGRRNNTGEIKHFSARLPLDLVPIYEFLRKNLDFQLDGNAVNNPFFFQELCQRNNQGYINVCGCAQYQ